MTIDELGRLAAKSKNWVWLDGMLAIVPSKHIGSTGYCFRLLGEPVGGLEGGYPDFSDKQTLEKLLLSVQYRWGKETTLLQDPANFWTIKGARTPGTENRPTHLGIYADTPLEAMLQALGIDTED